MALIDDKIASVNGRVTLFIDGRTSQNIRGYIAVFITFLSNTKNGPKINQQFLQIIPLLLHSSDRVFKDIEDNIIAKKEDRNNFSGSSFGP
jgi:hypothetical protein